MHGNLLPYDYFANRSGTTYGLARTATLLRQARSEAANCLLFDNGDFLQGTPLSDITALREGRPPGPHPVIAMMNALGYDAATLGNHEFNFGLDPLRTALAESTFPVVCANALTQRGNTPTADETLCPPWLTLRRQVLDSAGQTHPLTIGVLGLLPPQITTWDQFHLRDNITSRDMVETARAHLPDIREAGADIVVLLAHTGIGTGENGTNLENAGLALAQLTGVDAIVTGHTHEVFPNTDAAAPDGVDHANGTLNGVPAVMAGFRGSHLGVIDLCLTRQSGSWQTTAHQSLARPIRDADSGELAAADPTFTALAQPAHEATLQITQAPLGHCAQPLHSYLARTQSDPSVLAVTRAQRAELSRHLQGTDYAHLPILSASAPYKTGGRAGPGYFTDIPAGPLTLRHASDLYPFPNMLCGLHLTGMQIADWLERTASCFNQITPGASDQMLWNPEFPGHAFDTVDGLIYEIDLTQPARYDATGVLTNPSARRITALLHNEEPVDPDAEFILALNNYRAFGGGPFPIWPENQMVVVSHRNIRTIVAEFISSGGLAQRLAGKTWQFCPLPGTNVIIDTGPGLRLHLKNINNSGLEDLGDTEHGFARFRMAL